MSNHRDIPRYLATRARQLCDDPAFVHRVGMAASIYHDGRLSEMRGPQTRKELRQPHKVIVSAGRKYLHAASLLGIDESSVDYRAVRARVKSSEEMLEEIDRMQGNLNASAALPSLCARLSRAFDDFGVRESVASFVSDVIDCISPNGDAPPSYESIRKLKW